jgi:hypothetical protein
MNGPKRHLLLANCPPEASCHKRTLKNGPRCPKPPDKASNCQGFHVPRTLCPDQHLWQLTESRRKACKSLALRTKEQETLLMRDLALTTSCFDGAVMVMLPFDYRLPPSAGRRSSDAASAWACRRRRIRKAPPMSVTHFLAERYRRAGLACLFRLACLLAPGHIAYLSQATCDAAAPALASRQRAPW